MARLVALFGITHDPFLPRLLSSPREQWDQAARDTHERAERFRADLALSRPDAVVVVGNDHFHQLFLDNYPAFLVGRGDAFDGIFYDEEREFGLERCRLRGAGTLSRSIAARLLELGVDAAFSDELRVDHSIVVPLRLMRPELDLPIVPVYANCFAPPVPPARRFYEVGAALRTAVELTPTDERVAVIVSGHLSLELGAARMFSGGPSDPSFDERAEEWLRSGDVAAATELSFDDLVRSGNVTPAFLNFVLALGVARGKGATHAEALRRPGSSQPFFRWDIA